MSGIEFINLDDSSKTGSCYSCDICIVGAGAAGIYLAVKLAAKSLDVILLEAGDVRCATSSASRLDFAPIFMQDYYPGATQGRYFGIGGSTSHWGGLLVPHTKHDLRPNNSQYDPWDHIVRVVDNHSASVLKELGWKYDDSFCSYSRSQLGVTYKALNSAGFEVISSLFVPPRRKNFSTLLKKNSNRFSRLRLFYNAVVHGFEAIKQNETTRLRKVDIISHDGKRASVAAPRLILAAGAIESARMLLELNQSSSSPVIRPSSTPGQYLADHLSLPIANVSSNGIQRVIEQFGPKFDSGWLRSFRFIESSPPSSSPRAFTHFLFDTQNPGFALAKEIFDSVQNKRLPNVKMSKVFTGISGLAQLGFSRYAQSILHLPPDTKVQLQLDIEQTSIKKNKIILDDRLDKYGRPIAQIHWAITEQDLKNIRETAERILTKWPGEKPSLPDLVQINLSYETVKPHDAYHPVGTCRLGFDDEAVVDEDLKVCGLDNMWIVSTGVLPSAGTANPTFTMLCLADRLVDQLT